MIQDWMIRNSASSLELIPGYGTTNPDWNREAAVAHEYGMLAVYDPKNFITDWRAYSSNYFVGVQRAYVWGYISMAIGGYLVDPLDKRSGGMWEWRFQNASVEHSYAPRFERQV